MGVRDEAFPQFMLAMLFYGAANFTNTFGKPAALSARLTRLALTLPSAYYLYSFAFDNFGPLSRMENLAMVTVGAYAMMLVVPNGVGGLFETAAPHWIDSHSGARIPIPETLRGRVLFAIDLSMSVRGLSWFKGRRFNWCPTAVWKRQQFGVSRSAFFRTVFIEVAASLFIMDAFDTIDKSREWLTDTMHPVTTLPMHIQLFASLSLCVNTCVCMVLDLAMAATVAVALGSHTESWVDIFNSPFSSQSLTDFWTWRWHTMFRRGFELLSLPLLTLLPTKFHKKARPCIAFFISAVLHMVLMYRLETNEQYLHPGFWDQSILLCFMSQPVGIFFEQLVIIPTARALLPERWQTLPTRVFAWAWLLWSGRHWADVWARRGLWGPGEYQHLSGFSPIRGLWKGSGLYSDMCPLFYWCLHCQVKYHCNV